jgi:hypothetical protein
VRALLSDGARLVVVDADGGVQSWSLPRLDQAAWSERIRDGILFADLCRSGILYLGTPEESVLAFDADTGERRRSLVIPVLRESPRFARFDLETGAAVWGYPAGNLTVESADSSAGLLAVTEPIAAMDVAFDHRLVAHADRHGYLHLHSYCP